MHVEDDHLHNPQMGDTLDKVTRQKRMTTESKYIIIILLLVSNMSIKTVQEMIQVTENGLKHGIYMGWELHPICNSLSDIYVIKQIFNKSKPI